MKYYIIACTSGKGTKTLSLSLCLSRMRALINHVSTCVDANGLVFEPTEDALKTRFDENQTVQLFDKRDNQLIVAVREIEVEYLQEIGGIFSAIPDRSPFKINGLVCRSFDVSKRWEFSVDSIKHGFESTTLIVLSHQDMLDAYEHNGCWHARWNHPIHSTHLNFVFDFS